MDVRYHVEGLAEAIRAVEGSLTRATLQRAFRSAGLFVEAESKRRSPIRTGYLRNSIRVWRATASEAIIGPGAEYGAYVEFGTRRMSPRPYMRPAVEENLETLAEIFRAAVRRR